MFPTIRLLGKIIANQAIRNKWRNVSLAGIIALCLILARAELNRMRSDAAGSSFLPFNSSEIRVNESIFFLETNNEAEEFSARAMCSVESAARYNPDTPVFMLATSKTSIRRPPEYLLQLFANVRFRKVDITEVTRETEAEKLWQSGFLAASRFYYSHCSDMLRFTMTYKYGGVYLDQDVISLRAVPGTPKNFVMSAGNGQFIATAAFKLGSGHPVLRQTLKLLATRFDGHYWNKNGPVILTDAVEGICQKIPPTSINSDRFENWRCGHGLKILPPELGCPISAKEYRLFYDPVKNDQVVDRIKDGFLFHYFNKMRTGTDVQRDRDEIVVSEDQPLYKQMAKHCPETERRLLRDRIGKTY